MPTHTPVVREKLKPPVGPLSAAGVEGQRGGRLKDLLVAPPTPPAFERDPLAQRFEDEFSRRLDQPVDKRTVLEFLKQSGVKVLPAFLGRELLPGIIREQAAKNTSGKMPFDDFMGLVEQFRLLRSNEIDLKGINERKRSESSKARVSELNSTLRGFELLSDEQRTGGKSPKPEDALRSQLDDIGASVPELKAAMRKLQRGVAGPSSAESLPSPLDRIAFGLLQADPLVREQMLLGAQPGLDTGGRSSVRNARTQTQRTKSLAVLEDKVRNAKSLREKFSLILRSNLRLSRTEFAAVLVATGMGPKEAIDAATRLVPEQAGEGGLTPPGQTESSVDALRRRAGR